MFAFFAILIVSVIVVVATFGLLAWAIRNINDGHRYRALVTEAQRLKATSSNGGWVIQYKEGTAKRSIMIPDAKTEGEAVARFMKMGVRYSSIEAVNKS